MNGEKILQYRIEQPAYENAFFRYFIGTHTTFAKKVLIKTPKILLQGADKQAFVAEMRQLARLQHPTLTTLYDYMESEEGVYAVFDYQKGTTLADYIHLQNGLLPEANAIATLLQLVEMWEAAHKEGVFGGIIRPSYILLLQDYTLKVQEIALSQFYTRKMIAASNREDMARLAPEFWQDNTVIDERADIYSLGLLLFELLTARLPYANLNHQELRNKILHEALPAPSQLYPAISPTTEAIVRKATAKNPQERYQSCTEFRQALLDWKPTKTTQEAPAQGNAKPAKEATPQKQEKPAFRIEDYDQINLLPWAFGFSVVTFGFLTWSYVGATKTTKRDLIANIQDEGKIKFYQDSIANAQSRKAVADSVRRAQEIAKKGNTLEPYMHRVRLGESLDRIARRYYVTLDTLKKINNLSGKEVLKPKMGVKIPVKATYHVKDGETIEAIGQKFGVNPAVLKEVNQLYPKPAKAGEEPEPVIFEGKEIVIPLMMPAPVKKNK